MTVYLYNVHKRRNSTYRPSADGLKINCRLKDDVSILNPVFLFDLQWEGSGLPDANYLKWDTRYYFVNDIVFVTSRIVEIRCSVDVLATYRDSIFTQDVFVARSERGYNKWLYDQYVPMSSEFSWSVERSPALPNYSSGGSYLIRTVGRSATTSSVGIVTYAVTRQTMREILDFLFTDGNYDFLADATVKSFFNPFQYIVSVDWFPFAPINFCEDGKIQFENVLLGWWDTGVKAHVVNRDYLDPWLNVSVPSGRYDDFRDMSEQWGDVHIYLPGCGVFFLNPDDCNTSLDVRYSIDVATGQALVRVLRGGTEYVIGVFSGQMSTSVSIGQLQSDLQKPVSGVIDGISSFLSNPFKGVADLFGVTADIAMESNKPTPNFNGTAGNIGTINAVHNIYTFRKQYYATDYPGVQLGRPCCKHGKLSSYTGYVQCLGASVSISKALRDETIMINDFLNGGVFVE